MPGQLSKISNAIKAMLPPALLEHYYRWRWGKPREEAFTDIYTGHKWQGSESVSGIGSDLEHTLVIREELPKIISELRVDSILDGPCGDFAWMQHVPIGSCSYIGADIVQELVDLNQSKFGCPERRRSFLKLDLCQDQLPRVDLIICRDCMIHLENSEIMLLLANFKASQSKYLLATTYPGLAQNQNTVTGWCRPVNLEGSPFNLPAPMKRIVECYDESCQSARTLGLWRMADLTL